MQPSCPHFVFDTDTVCIDESNGRYGEVSFKTCRSCGQKWLHYFVTYEGFAESGRWYRGLIDNEIAAPMTPQFAIQLLESLDWHFYGGSYFKTSGRKGSGSVFVDL